MAEAKTKPTAVSVDAFIDAVEDPRRREDARAALALLCEATGEEPVMWGPSIIGFGRYHYRYDSGHEGDAPWSASRRERPIPSSTWRPMTTREATS